jgi:serine/threonine-protein kinase
MVDDTGGTLQAGTLINGKWVILEFIAKGGMGEVYHAHQLNLKRDVALKIISVEWLRSVEDNLQELEAGLQRFRNEVQAMAQVRHPNVLQIYDYGCFSFQRAGEESSMEYIAMEYVPGGTLWSTMSEEGFHPEETLTKEWLSDYFLPVLSGVEILHKAKIIHRDLKPGNILMDGKVPKIADFGLARSSRLRPVTNSLDMKGTPAYMSPEHFMDFRRADHRADVYSLGKMLYEAIQGKMGPETLPFKSANLPNPRTPFFLELDRIIRQATAEDRNERFGAIAEFRDAILSALRSLEYETSAPAPMPIGRPSVLSRPGWIWAGVTVASLLVLLMTLWHLLGEPGNPAHKVNGPPAQVSQPRPLDSSRLPDVPSSGGVVLRDVIKGKDGASLRGIPGGNFVFPDPIGPPAGGPVHINAFYMEETEVTNHQFVTFLNEVLQKVRVEENVVKGDGVIWAMLGEVVKGYEPIYYESGNFSIKDPTLHSHPAVRVTAYGATAYANYYGRRLPWRFEWLYATGTDEEAASEEDAWEPSSGSDSVSHKNMMRGETKPSVPPEKAQSTIPLPVAGFPANRYGLKGLNGNVMEWTTGSLSVRAPEGRPIRYVVMPEGVERHAWEAFEKVGFRTVVGLDID